MVTNTWLSVDYPREIFSLCCPTLAGNRALKVHEAFALFVMSNIRRQLGGKTVLLFGAFVIQHFFTLLSKALHAVCKGNLSTLKRFHKGA